ncbi:MAG: M23 family metallopeptidase [Vicinamibacterales bacterium]
MRRLRPEHWWIAAVSFTAGILIGSRYSSLNHTPPTSATVSASRPGAAPPVARSRDSAPSAPDVARAPAQKAPEPSPVTPADAEQSLEDLRHRDLKVPVSGVSRSDLRSSFHDTRDGSRVHEALDILAPRHTPVLAVEDGTVAKLFLSKAGGKTIYQFDPSGTYAYYYAHLEEYAAGLAEGARVKRGQQIGTVGTSGNAPPNTPHLHFGIFLLTPARHWWQGTPLDPFEVWRH